MGHGLEEESAQRDTLMSMANLTLTFWKQGQWTEAKELKVWDMDMMKRVPGEEHPTSMANLALLFWNQGQWNEAEEFRI